MRAIFLMFVAMAVLTTQSNARIFPTMSLVDTNGDIAIRDDDFHLFYADHHKHEHKHKHHHHKHNPHHGSHALPPNAPVAAPAQAPMSLWTWLW